MTTPFDEAAARVAEGADPRAEADALVAEMTVPERLGCLDGDEPFWTGLIDMMGGGYTTRTWPAAVVERLGVPGLHFADGPRGCVVGPATTFPVSMARGASFDPDLERRIGEVIGVELRAAGATYTGAVCMNLLRHPAWGRAQETYGEDPHHVGEMAAAFTEGLQHHVMACMKHFAVNSIENARFKVDVTADERALHEVYLPHFRRAAEAGVASVMNAYNSLNGEWCGDNFTLLTEILRDEWGWDGFVITDFIAGLRDPVGSVAAGCNVEMPFAQQRAVTLADALESGDLSIDDVDARVAETLATFLRFAHVYGPAVDASVLGCDEHRALARHAAVESMVLLGNDGLLPLEADSLSKVAVLGRLGRVASLGDGGSSNVAHTVDPVAPLDGLRARLPDAEVVHSDDDVAVVDGADVVVVVVGYTAADEGEYLGDGMNEVIAQLVPPLDHPVVGSDDPKVAQMLTAMMSGDDSGSSATGFGDNSSKGGDRTSLRLRADDEALIAAACAAHDRVVVAVVAGSAVVMPWLEQPAATLLSWYCGSEGGTALADVLFGVEPGGRLPFALPVDETHLVDFDKDAEAITYGLLHGQWWLDDQGVDAQLPFGFGLGYTEFALGEARLDAPGDATGDAVTVAVTNTGARAGRTVVQVYGSVPGSAYRRPTRRLVGFAKLPVEAGQTVDVTVPVDRRQLDVRAGGQWVREEMPVELSVGFCATETVTCSRR